MIVTPSLFIFLKKSHMVSLSSVSTPDKNEVLPVISPDNEQLYFTCEYDEHINDIYKPWPGGWGVYTNNFKMRALGGLKTDILSIAIEGTQESIDTGLLLPLDDMIKSSDELKDTSP